MKGWYWSRRSREILSLLFALSLCLLLIPSRAPAAEFPGVNYCSVPPFPGAGVKSNVLLMLDNSASMWDLAYVDRGTQTCSATTSWSCSSNADCPDQETCSGGRAPYYCFDDSYSDTASYSGYFDQKSFYGYDFTNGRFVTTSSLAPSGASGTVVASNGYLYVEMTPSTPPRTVTTFAARGNFLNWLATSKLDLEKQVLTGGTFQPDGSSGGGGLLIGETRGCQGKRFVKVAPDAPQITFAVGGPIPPMPASNCTFSASPVSVAACVSTFETLPSTGGGTRIKIFDAPFNKTPCMAAVTAWRAGTSSSFRANARSCLGGILTVPTWDGTERLINVPTERQIFVDAMSYCFTSYDPTPLGKPAQPTDLQSGCGSHIQYQRNSDSSSIPRNAGDAICGRGYTHVMVDTDTLGFMGGSYSNGSVSSITERSHFCTDLTKQLVTDPSTVALKLSGSSNVPSFIPDIGIYNLGNDNPPVPAATLYARVLVNAPPTGLLQEYSSDLNFGAMSFNFNGAGSECIPENDALKNGGIPDGQIACIRHCQSAGSDSGRECFVDADCSDLSGYSCQPVPLLDGGRVIAAVGLALGDHTAASAGVIYAIDQLKATSWSPLSETFYEAMGYFANRSDLRLQPDDFITGTPRPACQRNNVLMVTDGISTADRNPSVSGFIEKAVKNWGNPTDGMPASIRTTTATASTDAPRFQGSYNLDDLAWVARHKNINDFTQPIVWNRDYITSYVVYTGAPCGSYNTDGSCTTSYEGTPEKFMQMTAANGGGKLAKAQNPADLKQAFRSMLQEIAAGSGTDPCMASTGEGNGAVLLREQFYPAKSFDGGKTTVNWAGEMSSLWYYIDPFIGSSAGAGSAMREDSDGNGKLTLMGDKIVSFRYDAGSNKTWGYLSADANGDGIADGAESAVEVDQVKYLWRAGQLLWARDLTGSPRTIYTPLLSGGSALGGRGLMTFSSNNSAAITPYLNLQAGDPTAANVISFVEGFDPGDPSLRSRKVVNGSVPATPSDPQSKGIGVWKLGDIISSTAKLQSQVPLGSYQLSPPGGYGDVSYQAFIGTGDYQNRGMVFVGANDGMLHAFTSGSLNASASGDFQATLTGSTSGSEQWAFIPKNVLPYLKYITSPNYLHMYLVDGRVTLVDASIGNNASCPGSYWSCQKPASATFDPSQNTWRTVLIGGMGLGGASCGSSADCVATPLADPAAAGNQLGYSSYFALDVTDPNNPSLLWEFSNPALGYSTTAPAIIRIGDPKLNGRWFAVFGSGPTGPIDTASHQFLGCSSQELKFFVVDLRTGELVATIATGIANAFAGSLSGAGIDADRWKGQTQGGYQDDAFYVGYVRKSGTTTASCQLGGSVSWSGGVLRVMTKENPDPSQWQVSKVIDGIGPVTGGIAKLQDRKNHDLSLYFGTGRYFFGQDDMADRRALYGVKEPCYNIRKDGAIVSYDVLDASCTTWVDPAGLIDQTTTIHDVASTDPGWRIDLDAGHDGLGPERVVTAPTSTRGGAVFFSTYQPYNDPCEFGDSYLWGVGYGSGGVIQDATLKGKALVQLSSGGMQETDLKGFAKARRSGKGSGIPGGIKVVSNSGLKPLKKIIHIQER